MIEETIKKTREKMSKSIETFRRDLAAIRTGRATSALVENIHVDYYGSSVPIKQLASIAVPETKQIVLQPFDKGVIGEMDKALQKADLGAMPRVEGALIRIILPPLTEDRRKELVKTIKRHSEDIKVSIRNVRRDAIDEVKRAKEKKEITEDQEKHLDAEIQKLTDKEIQDVEKLVLLKEKEVMEV